MLCGNARDSLLVFNYRLVELLSSLLKSWLVADILRWLYGIRVTMIGGLSILRVNSMEYYNGLNITIEMPIMENKGEKYTKLSNIIII